jgi:predicted nuclease with RNAse H fold
VLANGDAVAGIDVGGRTKGFHAVTLLDGVFEGRNSTNPAQIVEWCLQRQVTIVAVDAPCGWSDLSRSRCAERCLKLEDKKIHCFATPTRAVALRHKKGFYEWVFNGERLYDLLAPHYPLFDGTFRKGPTSFETFPHAIVCSLAGKIVRAKSKVAIRRHILRTRSYDVTPLVNLDLIDAALCALTAEQFRLAARGKKR